MLSQHAKAPLHAMVGGGDQIYNDEVFSGKHVQEWLHSGRKVGLFTHSFIHLVDECLHLWCRTHSVKQGHV